MQHKSPVAVQHENHNTNTIVGRTIAGVYWMNSEQIRPVILDILKRIAPDEDLSDLQDDVPFREQMELDSMDFLDIVMELRKQYRVQIPEEDYENLTSMGSTITYLEPLLKDVEAPA